MSTTPRRMPKLLKATYLADQESLLEETRATKLYYFPGPIAWLIVWGLVTLFTATSLFDWPGQISSYNGALQTLASGLHLASGTFKTILLLVLLILDVAGLVWLLVRYVRWIVTVYAVTSRRVIIQKGILGKDFDEIPVSQVRGVDVHQTFGERILGYGTVRVSSEGGSRLGNEDWNGIPKPFRFQKLIENATQNQQAAPGPVQWSSSGR